MDELSLRIFLTLAKESSFSKTGEYHYLTQPAISRRIKKLEEFVGTKLFERGKGQRIHLTKVGSKFLEYAERIIALYDKLYEDLSKDSLNKKDGFLCGASTTIGEYILPKILSIYKKRNPDVEIFLKVENAKRIKELLLQKSICMGLVEEEIEEEEFECIKFLEDEFLLLMSDKHPISKRERVYFSDILNEPWIMREEGSCVRRMIEEVLKSKGLGISNLNITMELASTEALKNAVRENLGISLIPTLSVRKNLEGLVQKRVEDVNFFANFYICYNRYNKRTKACKEFLDFLLSLDFRQLLKE